MWEQKVTLIPVTVASPFIQNPAWSFKQILKRHTVQKGKCLNCPLGHLYHPQIENHVARDPGLNHPLKSSSAQKVTVQDPVSDQVTFRGRNSKPKGFIRFHLKRTQLPSLGHFISHLIKSKQPQIRGFSVFLAAKCNPDAKIVVAVYCLVALQLRDKVWRKTMKALVTFQQKLKLLFPCKGIYQHAPSLFYPASCYFFFKKGQLRKLSYPLSVMSKTLAHGVRSPVTCCVRICRVAMMWR